jgi:hypothetical protein
MEKTAPRSLLDELEAAIQSGSSERRSEMLGASPICSSTTRRA